MVEDDNEGVFGEPPPSGAFVRIDSAAALSTLSYRATRRTQKAWAESDHAVRKIIEKDGIGKHLGWTATPNALTAHPLSSCRVGDDPATSACDSTHELRGHAGLFVTDGSSVPTALCVNPSLTIAALAEQASRHRDQTRRGLRRLRPSGSDSPARQRITWPSTRPLRRGTRYCRRDRRRLATMEG